MNFRRLVSGPAAWDTLAGLATPFRPRAWTTPERFGPCAAAGGVSFVPRGTFEARDQGLSVRLSPDDPHAVVPA